MLICDFTVARVGLSMVGVGGGGGFVLESGGFSCVNRLSMFLTRVGMLQQ